MVTMAECVPRRPSRPTVELAKEEIICPLCIAEFRTPRSLKCLHSYCESCIEQLVSSSAEGTTVTCPECRAETILDQQGVNGLAINFKLQRFVEIIMSQNNEETNSAEPEAPLEVLESKCQLHQDKELEYYCEECRVLMCGKCMLENHRVHDGVKYASEAVEEHLQTLVDSVTPLNKSLADSAELTAALDANMADIRSATDEARVAVRNYFSRIHNLLKTREVAIMEEIAHTAAESEEVIATQRASVEGARSRVLQCVEQVQALKAQSNQLQVLVAEEHILSTSEESREQLELAITNAMMKGKLVFQSPFHTDLYFEAQCSVVGESPYQLPDPVPDSRPELPSPRIPPKSFSLRGDPRGSRVVEEPTYILMRGASEPFFHLTPSGSVSPVSTVSHHEEVIFPCLEITSKQLLGPTPRTAAVYPHAVGVGRPDLLVVVDSRNNNVTILTPTGRWLDRVEIEGRSDGSVMEPRAVCTGEDGSIFVVIRGTASKIRKFSSAGKLLTTIKSRALGSLTGITALPNGQVLVTDAYKRCVHVFEASGKSSGKLDIIDSEKPDIPSDITHDLRGNVIVADEGAHCIRVYSNNGRFLNSFGKKGSAHGELLNPQGVAADLYGNVFVADTGNHRVSVFTVAGRFVSCFGGKGSEPGQFLYPRHLCLDSQGRLVVADEQNQRLQIFDISDHALNQ